MAKQTLVLQNCPAFVYAAHNPSAIWRCTLKLVNCKEEFGLFLKFSQQNSDADGEQFVIFQYEGDNFVPGHNSLTETDIVVSAKELIDIQARNGTSRPRTMSLTLKEACTVWCPKEPSYVHIRFEDLLELARATDVRIFFDTRRLGNKFTDFQKIFEGSQQFKTMPVKDEFTKSHQKENWMMLNLKFGVAPAAYVPIEDTETRALPSIEYAGARASVVKDDPPSYDEHVPRKRPRCGTCSPQIPH